MGGGLALTPAVPVAVEFFGEDAGPGTPNPGFRLGSCLTLAFLPRVCPPAWTAASSSEAEMAELRYPESPLQSVVWGGLWDTESETPSQTCRLEAAGCSGAPSALRSTVLEGTF